MTTSVREALHAIGKAVSIKQLAHQRNQPFPLSLREFVGPLPAWTTSVREALHATGTAVSIKQLAHQRNEAFPLSLREFVGAPTGARAPRAILEIDYANPTPPFDQSNPDWAKNVAGGDFPIDSGFEWKQVLAPEDEYDESLVGASGWVIHPYLVDKDFPFSHPFDFDWEFELYPDPQYNNLLAPGNTDSTATDYQDEIKRANDMHLPSSAPDHRAHGVLGVEFDRALVPPSFRANVREGDRMAVFGRWIVDCGHDPKHTEIHPPLLLACAGHRTQGDGSRLTRVIFTSRPYLVGQKYSVDTGDIYKDNASDDGTFYSHIKHEVEKVLSFRSTMVEAHPKIKSFPFRGSHLLHLIVGAPPLDANAGTALNYKLVVSFHFTIRSGFAVEVRYNDAGSIAVSITMNAAGYTPPALPHRRDRTYSRTEIDELNHEAGKVYSMVELISGALSLVLGVLAAAVTAILSRGIKTDTYDALKEVDILDAQQAVMNVFATSIPAGAGVSVDDSQPFPLYGWIEAKWAPAGAQAV
jgi:hypothetical protein